MARILSVSEVNKIIKSALSLEPVLQRVQVRGEISNFKRYDSGHSYFTLKDGASVLKAVMFKGRGSLLRFKPQNGQMVLASGRIEVYERDGVYQLYVDNMFPDGEGDLAAAYEKLKSKLQEEGLFAAENKKELPMFPKTLGVITSSSGAVLHDIIKVARKRNPAVGIVFYPVRVQGEQAPSEIVHAINFMNKKNLADVLIIGRGGGSLEELWAFNDEKVVRAVAASNIPTISAVGHETDVTLCDFASDMRAATPSQAAELAVPDKQALLHQVCSLKTRLNYVMQKRLENIEIRINHALNSLVLKKPEFIFTSRMQYVDRLNERLLLAMKVNTGSKESMFRKLSAQLDALSPLAVLARGYSVTTYKDGSIIKNPAELSVGDIIKTRFADSSVYSKIQEGDL